MFHNAKVMTDEDARYQFIFDTVSKHSPTDLVLADFLSCPELAKFCDDAATLLLSCVFSKDGWLS